MRDEAVVRLYYNTGARLLEVGNLALADIDMATESVRYHGKGGKDRRVRFGPRTARALSRYLRARAKHVGAGLPDLWLAERGPRRLAPNGIKIMIKRRGAAAGLTGVHAHRWRHNFAHEWKRDTGDLMLLLGWASDDIPRQYGASAREHLHGERTAAALYCVLEVEWGSIGSAFEFFLWYTSRDRYIGHLLLND